MCSVWRDWTGEVKQAPREWSLEVAEKQRLVRDFVSASLSLSPSLSLPLPVSLPLRLSVSLSLSLSPTLLLCLPVCVSL